MDAEPFRPSEGERPAATFSPAVASPLPSRRRYVTSYRRRIVLPVVLFVATCFSTFFAQGVRLGLAPAPGGDTEAMVLHARVHWHDGIWYTVAVMSILVAHEMGHFLQTLRWRVPASLPYFIPFPISFIGTLGAVIAMRGSQANRRQLFDIGISGPLAGLVLAVPIAWYGVQVAELLPSHVPLEGEILFHDPLLFQALIAYLRPDAPDNPVFVNNPFYMAGWVGMLITGLNMLPISQLDGGHVAYALFGRRAHWLAWGMMSVAAGFILLAQQYVWLIMFVLLLLMRPAHPPTADDSVPLGWFRYTLGLASLFIPLLCLAPVPLTIV